MKTRRLGKTDLELPVLAFGASSLGAEFRPVSMDEVFGSVDAALDLGLNLIDTSPYYGRGMSEVLLGIALKNRNRDDYLLCTKLGRYDVDKFDFRPQRVAESVDVSLHRLGTDHVDIMLCHDVEFVSLDSIVNETIPALQEAKKAGKCRYVGVSGYPMKALKYIIENADIDCIMSYNQYTLQNTRLVDDVVPVANDNGVGVMNAGPFAARLLTDAPLPDWHKDSQEVRDAARRASALCQEHGSEIAKLALQFSCHNDAVATTVAGSSNPDNIRKWAAWLDEPMDEDLVAKVREIFAPVANISHPEGLPENN